MADRNYKHDDKDNSRVTVSAKERLLQIRLFIPGRNTGVPPLIALPFVECKIFLALEDWPHSEDDAGLVGRPTPQFLLTVYSSFPA